MKNDAYWCSPDLKDTLRIIRLNSGGFLEAAEAGKLRVVRDFF